MAGRGDFASRSNRATRSGSFAKRSGSDLTAVATEFGVTRAVDLAHASDAEEADDFCDPIRSQWEAMRLMALRNRKQQHLKNRVELLIKRTVDKRSISLLNTTMSGKDGDELAASPIAEYAHRNCPFEIPLERSIQNTHHGPAPAPSPPPFGTAKQLIDRRDEGRRMDSSIEVGSRASCLHGMSRPRRASRVESTCDKQVHRPRRGSFFWSPVILHAKRARQIDPARDILAREFQRRCRPR
jgi:hypothetical protein